MRNEYIRKTSLIEWFGKNVGEKRLRWFRMCAEEVCGCSAGGWCDRRRYQRQGEMDADDLLWDP